MSLRRILTACSVLLLVLGCSGCRSSYTGPAAPTTQTFGPSESGQAAVETPTPAVTPTPTAGVTEKQIGYVRKVYTENGVNYVSIDYVQFITGDAALEKAKKDGTAEQDENGNWYMDDGYYIINDSTQLRTFPLSPKCSIKVVDLTGENGVKMVGTTFAKLKSKGPTFGSNELFMHINVVDGVVQSLEEQYLP